MRKLLALAGLSLFTIQTAYGCSGEEETRKAPRTDAGVDAAGRGGSAGTAGGSGGSAGTTGGSGGSAGTAVDSGDAADAATVQCGDVTCSPAATPLGLTLAACCPVDLDGCGLDLSQAAALAGFSAGCLQVNQPGTEDASCPARSVSLGDAGTVQFPGCCRPNGNCGARVDLSSAAPGVNFGCVSTGVLPDSGPSQRCAGDASVDAGSDAASDSATDAAVPPMCSTAAPCSWRQAAPANSPPVLAWAAAAYDPVNDQIILFGGAPTINGGTTTDETWAWNGSNWNRLSPTRKPSARWTHGMAYDEERRRIVLFGGLATDQVGSALNDTWEWDGSNWNQVTTQTSPTPARGIHGAIAYDSVRKQIVIRGGGTFPGQTLYGDTWTYNGTDWTPVSGTGPGPRVAPAMAFDKARGELLLFGGGNWNPYFGDMWRFNGTTWSSITVTGGPSQRQSARMVFDSTRSLVLLFGGDNSSALADLWEWNGASWAPVSVTPPPARCCFAFAHDTRRGEAVIFGGPDNQTWIYGN